MIKKKIGDALTLALFQREREKENCAFP